MAKTPGKTSFVVSQPMMMGGGKDYQKTSPYGADSVRNKDSDRYVHDTYPFRGDLIRPPVILSDDQLQWRDIPALERAIKEGQVVWPETAIDGAMSLANIIDRIVMTAASSPEYFRTERRGDRIREFENYINSMISQIRFARELILLHRSTLDHTAITRMNRDLISLDRYSTFATNFLAQNSRLNLGDSFSKQTGFQAPSPLAPTKGSKGLLGNCSTAGQVVTGLVVGGAIFALYKTCKK